MNSPDRPSGTATVEVATVCPSSDVSACSRIPALCASAVSRSWPTGRSKEKSSHWFTVAPSAGRQAVVVSPSTAALTPERVSAPVAFVASACEELAVTVPPLCRTRVSGTGDSTG